MDMQSAPGYTTGYGTGTVTIIPSPALTEEDIRRIIREELKR